MRCLILAGGFATRLYPVTVNRAKALLDYQGRPVINYIVDKVPTDVEIMVAVNKKFETDFLVWQASQKRPVEVLVEEVVSNEQKKGAIGAVDHWIKTRPIQEDLMVIAADNYFDLDLGGMLAKFNRRSALIAVYDVGDKAKACEIGKACQVGLVTLKKDRISRLDEKPEQATSSIIATGIYIIPTRLFPLLDQYCREPKRDNLGSFVTYLLQRETVQAYTFNGVWMDIGDEILRGRLAV